MKRATLMGISVAAVILTACGGSGGNSGNVMAGGPSPADNPPVADAFYSLVAGQVSTTSEDKEPVAIDAFAVTSPEASEPVAI